MRKWKLAISSADDAPATSPILLKGTVCDNLKAAASLGYDAIEVHMRETEPIDVERISDIMEKYKVKIAMLVTGRLNTEAHLSLMDDDAQIAAQAREGLKHYIDIAEQLGAGIVIGWAKGKVPAGKEKRPYMDRLAQHLAALGEYGQIRNVPLNLEVINRYETNIFNTAYETVDFLKKYSLKNCFVHLDTFHMNIEENDMYEAIRCTKGLLGYFHIADNDRNFIGHGMLNCRKIFDTLEETGYKGYISVECLPLPDALTAARNSLSHIKKCASGFEGFK